MATFQIDDLIVSVFPETIEAAAGCPDSGCTNTCSGCSDSPKSCSGCSRTSDTCSGCTNSVLEADSPAGMIGNLEAFEALQAQLSRELDGAFVN